MANMKQILRTLDKLYISFALVIFVVAGFVSYDDWVAGASRGNERHDRAHAIYNRINSDLKKSNSSLDMILANQQKRTEPCFSYTGELLEMNQYTSCYQTIQSFTRKVVFIEFLKFVGIMASIAIGAVLLRVWGIWLFRHKEDV